ncbi:unnamed protein product [Psylliodes chrysocephalus]|uniref:Uncharacterized protein n=1 Tax=Psylliodes chrysocephalus TaxID=3402493 RepID=A0A9P0CJ69_9CUCU|nr:unnamed protein product [Psylliodes chrysocephala]
MGQNWLFSCGLSIILYMLSVLECYNENITAPCANVSIKQNTCVNVFYSQEDFYKIHCFDYLPEYNASLGIITDKNDTIVFKDSEKNRECFDIYRPNSTSTSTHCLNVTYTNYCLKENVTIVNSTRSQGDKQYCKTDKEQRTFGILSDDLNFVLRCVISGINELFNIDKLLESRFLFHVPNNYPDRE